MAEIDHDTLIRIDENVKMIAERLLIGDKKMEIHEVRIRTLENACTPKHICDEKHSQLTKAYITLLVALLVSALGIIGTLVATR